MPERSEFVSNLAKTGIVASVILLLLQIIAILPETPPSAEEAELMAMIPPEFLQGISSEPDPVLEVAMIVLTVVTLLLSWFLLQRKEWARRGFIGLLIASIGLHVYGAMAMMQRFEAIAAVMLGDAASREAIDAVDRIELIFDGVVVGFTVLASLLFAWLAWKLTTPRFRQEFAG